MRVLPTRQSRTQTPPPLASLPVPMHRPTNHPTNDIDNDKVHHVGDCFKRRALEKLPLAVASAIFVGDETGHSRNGGGLPQGARVRDAKIRVNGRRKRGSGKSAHKRGSFERGSGSCSDSSDSSSSSDSGSDSDSDSGGGGGGGGGGGSIRDSSSPDYAQVPGSLK